MVQKDHTILPAHCTHVLALEHRVGHHSPDMLKLSLLSKLALTL